ncbi:hypothetical protein JX265_009831 [Neoarthrinium moseri]|uniref:Uncharacterized protein n=1 Tax=Neoarthrinium moseri TaxID=1658444 RepID=A0A9Q0AM37_9PEZI|nr:uncharacterized protein JN550_005416 [Neoarthrinium moseri]KAI1852857.1 hypothetical protein JX266_002398 [Neoarthrinium moseri]KAI1860432.1 hypothetical protein JX265_009831 [Neoarthrinium moseri]KAI1869826.1 hypothetical protein JN550_005416 [Neoarthrinium moseri]
MGTTFSAVKTLIVPAVISLIIFLICTYVLVPLWRQYRQRYSQYLPLDTISDRTSSLRARVQGAIANLIIPSRFRMGVRERLVSAEDSDAGFDSDDGEELDVVDDDRRHALSLDTSGRREQTDSIRRLSRDLEEGFMDDSDEEGDNRPRR